MMCGEWKIFYIIDFTLKESQERVFFILKMRVYEWREGGRKESGA